MELKAGTNENLGKTGKSEGFKREEVVELTRIELATS